MQSDELSRIRIKKVSRPTNNGTAVLLGNDEKTFLMFIGLYEGMALHRELNSESPPRPLTHELLSYVMAGFNIEIKKIIISDIVENTFCATLILEQKVVDPENEWVGKRNEVRIDARPSDCLVLALKENKEIWCAKRVLDKVDITEELGSTLQNLKLDVEGQQFKFELPQFDPEDLDLPDFGDE